VEESDNLNEEEVDPNFDNNSFNSSGENDNVRRPTVIAFVSESRSKSDENQYSQAPSMTQSHSSLSGISAMDSSSNFSTQGTLQLLHDSEFSGNRANSTTSYFEVNRTLSKFMPEKIASSVEISPRCQIGPESVVGEGSHIGERVSVKKSVIGAYCVIGRGVKLVNSVIMDHAVIEDDVKLESTIVCSHAKVSEKAQLKDCIVAAKCFIPKEGLFFLFSFYCFVAPESIIANLIRSFE
jgi:translation initiation factor eIF-2B subunit gamma